MKRLLILANSDSAIFKFRKELIEALSQKFHIGIGVPFGLYIDEIRNDDYDFFDIPVNRHGLNPIEDLKLLNKYRSTIKLFQPDVVLLYTIKPNLYGALACALQKVPCLCNITGLGSALEKKGLLQKLLVIMYKVAMRRVHTIFFQNTHGQEFFDNRKIGNRSQYYLLPGSGVNLEKFQLCSFPVEDVMRFVFVARIIKEKGIDEFLYVAEEFHKKGLKAEFHICGACEEAYQQKLQDLHEQNIIVYHGLLKDMRQVYKTASCIVLPSYYPEGQSNVLLEGAATGRPLITTDHPGCREAVDNNITGLIVRKKDKIDLLEKCVAMFNKNRNELAEMGLNGRKKMEQEFDRNIVIRAYQERIGQSISNS